MSKTDQKLADLIKTKPLKLRLKILRQYHAIEQARRIGLSWTQIAASIDAASGDGVMKAWASLQSAIQSGKIMPPPPDFDLEAFLQIAPQPISRTNAPPVELRAQPDIPVPPTVPSLPFKRIDNPLPIQAPRRMTPAEFDRRIEEEAEAELAAARAEFRSRNSNK